MFSRLYKAVLLAIAVLLIVSCPLKRMMQENFLPLSLAKKGIQINPRQDSSAEYASQIFSCVAENESLFTQSTVNKKQILPLQPFFAEKSETGYALHYFLSGIEKASIAYVNTTLSNLPLFLQHRRLLI